MPQFVPMKVSIRVVDFFTRAVRDFEGAIKGATLSEDFFPVRWVLRDLHLLLIGIKLAANWVFGNLSC